MKLIWPFVSKVTWISPELRKPENWMNLPDKVTWLSVRVRSRSEFSVTSRSFFLSFISVHKSSCASPLELAFIDDDSTTGGLVAPVVTVVLDSNDVCCCCCCCADDLSWRSLILADFIGGPELSSPFTSSSRFFDRFLLFTVVVLFLSWFSSSLSSSSITSRKKNISNFYLSLRISKKMCLENYIRVRVSFVAMNTFFWRSAIRVHRSRSRSFVSVRPQTVSQETWEFQNETKL